MSKEVRNQNGALIQKVENKYNDDPLRYEDYVKSIDLTIIKDAARPFVRLAANKIYTFYPYLKNKTETYYPNGSNPIIKVTDYQYNNYRQIAEEKTTTSTGQTTRTTFKYAGDLADSYTITQNPNVPIHPISRAIVSMGRNPNMLYPIETVQYRSGKITGATVNTFSEVASDLFLPYQTLALELSQPLDPTQYQSPYFSRGFFYADPKLRPQLSYKTYGPLGNLTSVEKAGIKTSYVWGYKNSLPIAKVQNAQPNQIAYTSFEPDSPGGWSYSGWDGQASTLLQASAAVSGQRGYHLNGTWGVGRGNLPPGEYTISFWAKGGRANVYIFTEQELGWTQGPPNLQGFCLIQSRIRITQGSASNPTGGINIDAYGREVDIDDVRIHPVDAQMTSYTHNLLAGVTSQSDTNNQPIRYQYDGFQRLQLVIDQMGNLIKSYQYNYKPQ